jgi:hypothetical protein
MSNRKEALTKGMNNEKANQSNINPAIDPLIHPIEDEE